MKTKQKDAFNRPFSKLKSLVDENRLDLSPPPESRHRRPARLTRQQEDELFARAMGDVTPLKHNQHWQLPRNPLTVISTRNREEQAPAAGTADPAAGG